MVSSYFFEGTDATVLNMAKTATHSTKPLFTITCFQEQPVLAKLPEIYKYETAKTCIHALITGSIDG